MEYIVPKAALNSLDYPRNGLDSDYMEGRDETYPIRWDWFFANAKRFYVTKEEVAAAAISRFPNMGYQFYCGVYFLLLDGRPFYIGSSKNIDKRLSEHPWTRIPEVKIAWIETPEWCVSEVESYYINTFKPVINEKIPTFCRLCNQIALHESHLVTDTLQEPSEI